MRITAPKAARTVGLAWRAADPAAGPVRAFRDFALRQEGGLLR